MNMFKKNGGFTLVELIVVIAILAILAGVAVPAYSGYIKRANDTAVLAELDAIQTAGQSACALEGTTLAKITVSNAGVIDVTAADTTLDAKVEATFDEFYTTTEEKLKELIGKHSVAKTSGAEWTVANNNWNILMDNDEG